MFSVRVGMDVQHLGLLSPLLIAPWGVQHSPPYHPSYQYLIKILRIIFVSLINAAQTPADLRRPSDIPPFTLVVSALSRRHRVHLPCCVADSAADSAILRPPAQCTNTRNISRIAFRSVVSPSLVHPV